jgi:hypothetical protein
LNNRLILLRAIKYLSGLLALALLYVLVDFTVDLRPRDIHSSYRFTVPQLSLDTPVWLRQDNLTIVVIRRSQRVIANLTKPGPDLQDNNSESSSQPDYASNILRSSNEEYFVAYGLGTDFGCPLIADDEFTLRESCGSARYDFAGRAISGNSRFLNLRIPDYNFSPDFSILTVRP